uniref:Putative secreted peptide n=1 Tax=Anopheles braziliensis TaxID=58242 RepID=A0A2M3ZVX5_9DIPT
MCEWCGSCVVALHGVTSSSEVCCRRCGRRSDSSYRTRTEDPQNGRRRSFVQHRPEWCIDSRRINQHRL